MTCQREPFAAMNAVMQIQYRKDEFSILRRIRRLRLPDKLTVRTREGSMYLGHGRCLTVAALVLFMVAAGTAHSQEHAAVTASSEEQRCAALLGADMENDFAAPGRVTAARLVAVPVAGGESGRDRYAGGSDPDGPRSRRAIRAAAIRYGQKATSRSSR